MESINKYPRTPHLTGSRFGPGDDNLRAIAFEEIASKSIVVEEKLDGANCGISFDSSGQLRLQSRGHYLTGGPRETQFDLLKRWANERHASLWDTLADRYLLYGEWMYAKHTIFYDKLPEYFVEFDVYDRTEQAFLDTPRRQNLLEGLTITSAPVLFTGSLEHEKDLLGLLAPSRFISQHPRDSFQAQIDASRHDRQMALDETDLSGQMEGLYIKVEENGIVTDRMKFVRDGFRAYVDNSGSHWFNRPIVRNVAAS